MTEEPYEELVRVRAQVMCRDEGTGGWVALGGGGLANVMVGRKTKELPYNNNGRGSGGESSSDENGSRSTHAHAPIYEYFIHGKRISDQSVVLSCTLKKDFLYYKVMPTFHHWVTEEKRFGLTFQTAADARAFDKGVRTALQDIWNGLGGTWPSLHAYKKQYPEPKQKEDDEENNIFECLNLPSDSRSSSENSTASRSHQRRGITTEHADISSHILSAINLPSRVSSPRNTYLTEATPLANKELLMKQKLAGSCSEEPDLYQSDTIAENYSYVQLTAVHEYTYPQLGPGGVITTEAPPPGKPPLAKRDSGSIKKRGMPCYSPGPPPLPDKKPTKAETTFHARLKCRHCHEWYLESANRAGACEYAPDCFKSCIDAVSCMKGAQCMLYHCMSDAEGEFATHPCACGPIDDTCGKRWIGLSLLSLIFPCLCCYPFLRCTHCTARACRLAGGKHAPHLPSQH